MDNKHISLTINHLQVPFVVRDILNGKDNFNDSCYALSALLSDLDPQSALLSIAVSARYIIQPLMNASATLRAMDVQCGRIVEEFSTPVSAQNINAQSFEGLADEFDYLDELLGLAMEFLNAKDPTAFSLCRLLRAAAGANKLITEALAHSAEQKSKNLTGPSGTPSTNTSNDIHAIYARKDTLASHAIICSQTQAENVIFLSERV